jgi:hypothetical protein
MYDAKYGMDNGHTVNRSILKEKLCREILNSVSFNIKNVSLTTVAKQLNKLYAAPSGWRF